MQQTRIPSLRSAAKQSRKQRIDCFVPRNDDSEIPHSVRNDAPRGTGKKAVSGGCAAADCPLSFIGRACHFERSEKPNAMRTRHFERSEKPQQQLII
jgi:hypothetical protein